MVFLVASLGTSLPSFIFFGLIFFLFSFGLLHRIPPQPEDRVPGTIPAELQDQDAYTDQEIFVPADTHGREQPIRHSYDRFSEVSGKNSQRASPGATNHRPISSSGNSPYA